MRDVARCRRCPCCNGQFGVSELRPVRFVDSNVRQPRVGERTELVLLHRTRSQRGATLMAEKSLATVPQLPRADAVSKCSPFSKLTLCDAASSRVAWTRHRAELAEALAKADDSVERRDVNRAAATMEAVFAAIAQKYFDADKADQHARRGEASGGTGTGLVEDAAAEKRFVFYGRCDGQHVYLHPLALRGLLAAVGGDADLLPRVVSAEVTQLERFEHGEDSRKKMPWLAHVTSGVAVHLVDLELRSLRGDGDGDWGARCAACVEAEPELKRCAEARLDRLRKAREVERREERRDAARSRRCVRERDARRFELRAADFVPLSTEDVFYEPDPVAEDATPPPSPQLTASPPEPSFAALVAKGFAAEFGCPTLGGAREQCDAAPTPRWGPPDRSAAACAAPVRTLGANRLLEHDAGELAFAPVCFGGALDAALRGAVVDRRAGVDDDASSAAPKQPGATAKKQRGTKLNLTGGGRRY